MLTKRVIPCLDINGGRVVKGIRFQNLRDAGDPVEQAVLYEQTGADELVILDVSATIEARATALQTIADLRRAISIPLSVGGGVRTVDHALALLRAGADKVGINSAAVDDPSILQRVADIVGAQCVVLSVDAARRENGPGWEVVTRSGTHRTGIDAIEWIARAAVMGAGELLLTSFDRDGTRSGYDTELLSHARNVSSLPIIASGGADSSQHMIDAISAGADAVLAASIFHDHDTTPSKIKSELACANIEVRP